MKKIFITGGSGFIGTNFIDVFAGKEYEILNYDLSSPLKKEHIPYWEKGDLMNASELRKKLVDFNPDWVVHLAARTDCDENITVEDGYQVNTTGTDNLLQAVKACSQVDRVIITSTQFVCGPGRLPKHDEDYYPHTVYGQSKVETERLTRSANLDCCWTLIRPTNVWGPWHMRYSREFWKIVDKGLYFHPGVKSPTRSYGYVGNLVWQVIEILNAQKDNVDGEVFYVGDRSVVIQKWIEAFHHEISNGKKMKAIPFPILKGIGKVGDLISSVMGKPFYITTSRLKSMTTDYDTPMAKTFELLGEPPYSLETGVRETVKWFKCWKNGR